MTAANDTVGDVLRDWRRRRRFSQLDLALEAEVSARHLSFVESGRSAASRDVLLRLAERLALPLRERNRLLLAGGYAPVYAERSLGRPDMAAAMEAPVPFSRPTCPSRRSRSIGTGASWPPTRLSRRFSEASRLT